jgi:hypothetical protein
VSVNSAMARPEDNVGFDGRTKPIDVRQGDSDLNTAIEIPPAPLWKRGELRLVSIRKGPEFLLPLDGGGWVGVKSDVIADT